jgi:hypothetical protein
MKEQTLEQKLKALSLDELNKWTIKRIYSNDPVRKAKISEANKGNKLSDEHKLAVSQAQSGRTLSDETKRKISEANKGRKRTDETKDKISQSKRKLTEVQHLEIKHKYATGKYTVHDLGKEYGVHHSSIRNYLKRG